MSPEFLLIKQQITPLAGGGKEVVLGIGDDAALLSFCDNLEQVVAMDTLVAGRHFFLDQSAFDVGWKSLAVNLSDLASMGAEPKFALLSLSLPDKDNRTIWVSEFMRGWESLANQYGVALVGGDTTSSPILSISVTVIGYRPAKSDKMLRHSGRIGDDIWVSGYIGSAGLALALLLEGKEISETLAQALHRPQPRVQLGQRLLPHIHAAMDISDGLLGDLTHILQASGNLGAELSWEAVPMLRDVRDWAEEAAHLPLVAGDDYELLFTAPRESRDLLLRLSASVGVAICHIGQLTEKEGISITKGGQALHLPNQLGFDHFQS